MNKYFKLILLQIAAVFILCINGCTDKPPIDEDKFVNIYTDILIQQDTSDVNGKKLELIKSKVLSKYNVTGKEYSETLDFYNQKKDRWKDFFDKAIKHIEDLKTENARKLVDEKKAQKDTLKK